jgi:hypothetical protein
MKPTSSHPLVEKSKKYKPYEMPAHYGIACGFTRIIMDKTYKNSFMCKTKH